MIFMSRFFNLLGRVGCALGAGLVLTQVASAQYGLNSGVYNRLSQRVPANNTTHIPPVGPNAAPTGDPLITPQYANVVEANASAGPISSGYARSATGSAGVILRNASLGTSFASGVPRYFFGDQIMPPASIINGAGVTRVITDPATYWRAEPVRAGELVLNDASVSVGLSGMAPDQALLGQSFLKQFDVEISREAMVLRRRP